jgi:hypothetical protein
MKAKIRDVNIYIDDVLKSCFRQAVMQINSSRSSCPSDTTYMRRHENGSLEQLGLKVSA